MHLPLLSPDLLRRVLLAARGGLQPLTGSASSFEADLAAWMGWWTLVVRVACTCRGLREALLGPGSGQLWLWVNISYGLASSRQQRTQGLHQLMRCQAHHAHSARVWWDCPPGETAELAACMAALTSLQHLELAGVTSVTGPCIAASLGSMPASICCDGLDLWTCLSPTALEHVTHARLSFYEALQPEVVQTLAQRLPRLTRLELSASLGSQQTAEALGILSLLSVAELCLELGLVRKRPAGGALRQLARSGVRIQSLLLLEGRGELTVADERLLAECCIQESLVVCFWDSARQLLHVPIGPAVRYS